MLKLCLKIILFAILLILILQVPYVFLPYYWGNDYIIPKMKYLEQHPGNFNAIFLGSSRSYRGINPRLFDTLADPSFHIRSFNLSTPGASVPECYYIYDHFINSGRYPIKYAFLELQAMNTLTGSNMHTARYKYWMTFKQYTLAFRSFIFDKRKLGEKIGIIGKYTITFIERLFCFNLYNDIAVVKKNISREHLGELNNGFVPFVEEGDEIGRKQLHLAGHEGRTGRAKLQFRNYNKKRIDQTHLSKINRLIKKSRKKGIYLIFYLPPKMPDYDGLIQLSLAIDPDHCVDLANPDTYPDLWELEHSYDTAHVNLEGSTILTTYLAEYFKAVIQDKY